MSENSEECILVKDAIDKLSESKGKMNIEDIRRETGIKEPGAILKELDNKGIIYYVDSTEFKKTP